MEGSATSKIRAEDGRGRISDVPHHIVTFEVQGVWKYLLTLLASKLPALQSGGKMHQFKPMLLQQKRNGTMAYFLRAARGSAPG